MSVITGLRLPLHARFERFRAEQDWKGRPVYQVLLVNVQHPDGGAVCAHAWLNAGQQFDRLHLQPGDAVQFVARVEADGRGVKLSHPSQVERL